MTPVCYKQCPTLGSIGQNSRWSLAIAALVMSFAFFVSASANAQQSNLSAQGQVEQIFSDFGGAEKPGVSVLVVKDGAVQAEFISGLADVGSDIPISDESVFNIGSISKQFTVFGILLLRNEGKLSLDDDVRTFIPELPDYGAPITLEQLARHTSGLRSQQYGALMGSWTQTDERTHSQMIDLIRRQRALMFEPGTQFAYSNAGTTLLAEVITRVSGMPFQRFMAERVYAPLDMVDTFNRMEAAQIISKEVHSYYREDGRLKKAVNPSGVQGYTNVYSTTRDLAKWADNLKTGAVGGLNAVRDLMSVTDLPGERQIEHRMGLYATPYRGFRQFQHTGSDRGYTSYLGWFPDADLTIIILSNIEGIDVFRSAYAIADLYLPSGLGPLADRPDNGGKEASTLTLSDDQLRGYTGAFWSDQLGDIRRISLADGQLRYVRSAESFSPLVPLGNDRFRLADAVSPAFVTIGGAGMEFEDTNGTIGFERIAAVPEDRLTLLGLDGLYVSDEISSTYRLSVCGREVRATNAVQNRLIFVPVAADIYRSNGWFLRSIRILRDDNGDVIGFDAGNVGSSGIRFFKVSSPHLKEPQYDPCRPMKPLARG